MIGRRGFLTGLGAALITAPSIVRAASLMPVKQMPWTPPQTITFDIEVRGVEPGAVYMCVRAGTLWGRRLIGQPRWVKLGEHGVPFEARPFDV